MILSICDDPKTMEIINIVIKIINVLKIVIPIILLFVLMIRFAKASLSKSEEEVNKIEKSVVPNIVAAMLIFLIPTAINLIVEIFLLNKIAKKRKQIYKFCIFSSQYIFFFFLLSFLDLLEQFLLHLLLMNFHYLLSNYF